MKKASEVNKELLLTNSEFLVVASTDLRADIDVILKAVAKDGRYLQYASEDLRANKKVVLTALHKRGYALEYASEDLRADKEVVLYAIYRSGFNLKYASKELCDDREVVLAAVTKMSGAIKYASKNLQVDKEILLHAYACGWEYMETSTFDKIRIKEYINNIRIGIKYAKFILHYSRVKKQNIFHKLNQCGINIIVSFLSSCQYTIKDYDCSIKMKTVKKAYKNLNNYFLFIKSYGF